MREAGTDAVDRSGRVIVCFGFTVTGAKLTVVHAVERGVARVVYANPGTVEVNVVVVVAVAVGVG